MLLEMQLIANMKHFPKSTREEYSSERILAYLPFLLQMHC